MFSLTFLGVTKIVIAYFKCVTERSYIHETMLMFTPKSLENRKKHVL